MVGRVSDEQRGNVAKEAIVAKRMSASSRLARENT
jgi:hypothetical protein